VVFCWGGWDHDALIIRAKLLAGYPDEHWLRASEETLRRAQELAPEHPRLPNAEAALFRQFGEYDKALQANGEAINRAISAAERHNERISRANLLLDLGRNEDALAEYDQILHEREDPWTWHNRSLALMRLSRNEEALASSDRALALMEFSNARDVNDRLRKQLGRERRR
jgi:tetratricopeptide (TPR) repeat protein